MLDGNESLLTEAAALNAEASARGLTLKLMGGMAVRALCPSSREAPFARICGDLDFFTLATAAPVEELFARRLWVPDAPFNLYNGQTRLKFRHPGLGKSADIFLGRFTMCHELRLDRHLDPRQATLPLAELLLTKLQVVEANSKDFADLFCLLADHEIGTASEGLLDAGDFASACAADWGLQTTVERSFDKLRTWMTASDLDGVAGERVRMRIENLLAALRAEPKGLAWKARALVGTRARWYELPEEVE